MHWLLLRPAIGWGAFLLIHAVGIPAVYRFGKMCAEKNKNRHAATHYEPEIEVEDEFLKAH